MCRKLPRFHPRVNKTEIIYLDFNERTDMLERQKLNYLLLLLLLLLPSHSTRSSTIITASLIVHCNSSLIRKL